MSKLVDKERLAKLAKALDDRAKNHVAGEAALRIAADEALQAAIDAINNEQSGILALAKAYADQQDGAAEEAQKVFNDDFEERIAEIEAKFGDGEGTVEDMIKAVEDALDAHKTAQATKDGEQDVAIAAAQKAADDEKVRAEAAEKGLADRLDVIEGEADGSIKKAVKDLADRHDEEMDAIEGRAAALEEVVGKAATETDAATGLVLKAAQNAQAIAQEAEDRAAADQALEGRVNQKIADDIAAESALRVAEEQRIEKALEDEAAEIRGEMAAEASRVDKALADEAAEIRGEMEVEAARVDKKIGDDIAAESAKRVAAEEALQGNIDKAVEDLEGAMAEAHNTMNQAMLDAVAVVQGEVDALEGVHAADKATQAEKDAAQDKAISDEATRAAGKEAELAQAIADEKAAQKLINEDIEGRVSANETFVAAQPAIDAEQDRRLGVLEAKFDGEESVDAKIAAAEQAAKDYADQKDTANKNAQALVDEAQNGRLDNLEAFKNGHDHSVMEQGIADNKAAIEVINGTGAGSIKKAIADLVNGAPEAADTLNELAQSIKDNKDIYDGWVAQHEQAMATMKSDLQAEIDADVKVVADALDNEKDVNVEGSLAKKIADEAARADAAEKVNAAAVVTEKERAEEQEAAIRQEMANALGVYSSGEGDEAVAASGLRKEIEDAHKAMDQALDDEVQDRKDADDALHATIKGEMAAVIQSLAVGIVDGKLRVALGGIEGDDVLIIREQEIDMVTDADIEEIIAGLDAPAAE